MSPQKNHSTLWSVRAAGISDVGRVRQDNEDRYLIAPECHLFIVSDGMGGRQGGAIAAQAVITVLPALLGQRMDRLSAPGRVKREQMLREAIVELSQHLRAESSGRVGLHGMGATIAVAWLYEEDAHLAHLGDSRIYLFRENHLLPLSEDHSVVALLLKLGEITPQEARTHPARTQLSCYMGMEGKVMPDMRMVHLQATDRLLLCSDGLTHLISDEQRHLAV